MKFKKLFLIFLSVCSTLNLSVFLHAKDPAASTAGYPGHEKPSCLTRPVEKKTSEFYQKGVERAGEALGKPYKDPASVWDQSVITPDTKLGKALQDFENGVRGKSVRSLKLGGQSADKVHDLLLAAGFQHRRVPLFAKKEKGKAVFWRRDGTTTTDSKDDQLVPMDIYVHPDGGMVRVKPEGVPKPGRGQKPHATKAVLYEGPPKKEGSPDNKDVVDTRYQREAFKISEEGHPLPKGISSKVGLRFIAPLENAHNNPEQAHQRRQERKGWIATIMEAAHIPLASDFSHCGAIKEKDEKSTNPES